MGMAAINKVARVMAVAPEMVTDTGPVAALAAIAKAIHVPVLAHRHCKKPLCENAGAFYIWRKR